MMMPSYDANIWPLPPHSHHNLQDYFIERLLQFNFTILLDRELINLLILNGYLSPMPWKVVLPITTIYILV